jgi:hypothetical protein
MFSGEPADPPGDGYITRNSRDAEQFMTGWWPGDPSHPKAAFYAVTYPAAGQFEQATLAPEAAYWDENLGEFILDWDDVRAFPEPHAAAVEFAHSAFRHGAEARMWDIALLASAEGARPSSNLSGTRDLRVFRGSVAALHRRRSWHHPGLREDRACLVSDCCAR